MLLNVLLTYKFFCNKSWGNKTINKVVGEDRCFEIGNVILGLELETNHSFHGSDALKFLDGRG